MGAFDWNHANSTKWIQNDFADLDIRNLGHAISNGTLVSLVEFGNLRVEGCEGEMRSAAIRQLGAKRDTHPHSVHEDVHKHLHVILFHLRLPSILLDEPATEFSIQFHRFELLFASTILLDQS